MSDQDKRELSNTLTGEQCGLVADHDGTLRPGAVCVRPKGHDKYHGTDLDLQTSDDGYFWYVPENDARKRLETEAKQEHWAVVKADGTLQPNLMYDTEAEANAKCRSSLGETVSLVALSGPNSKPAAPEQVELPHRPSEATGNDYIEAYAWWDEVKPENKRLAAVHVFAQRLGYMRQVASLEAHIRTLSEQLEAEEKATLEEIDNRDEFESRLTALAEAVGEYFNIDVGEWSNANDPAEEAHKILNGEYVLPSSPAAEEKSR